MCASKSFCRRGRPQLADFHPLSLWLEVSLVGDIVGWRCLWLEVGGRVLQGEAKKGQGQLKKVATEPKISILPLFGWGCLWLEVGGRVLQGEARRDQDS